MQVRFLFDNYDLSSAAFYSQQKDNMILAGINFMTNGGGKHISIDRLVNGKLRAKDLRLRFEIGNMNDVSALNLPAQVNQKFDLKIDEVNMGLQLYYSAFGDLKGRWEKGSDGKIAWVDYVIYSGEEREFDLLKTDKAALGFAFVIDGNSSKKDFAKVEMAQQDSTLTATWNGMNLSISSKPQTLKHTSF